MSKNASFVVNLSKTELWVEFGFFFFIPQFLQQNGTWSTSFTVTLSCKLVEICLHSNNSKQFTHVATVEINENWKFAFGREKKATQYWYCYVSKHSHWTSKKKASNLNARMVERNKNSFFLELGRKKRHINTNISFLQKRIKVKFFFRLWQSSHEETYSRFVLNAWRLRKKFRKKKPFCSKVCLCIQTFSTWYYRKTFQSVDH